MGQDDEAPDAHARVQWVYQASSREDLEARYDRWARDYDADLRDDFGYLAPPLAVAKAKPLMGADPLILDAEALRDLEPRGTFEDEVLAAYETDAGFVDAGRTLAAIAVAIGLIDVGSTRAVINRVDDRIAEGVVCIPKGAWNKSSLNGRVSTALSPATVNEVAGGACFNYARVEVALLD